METRNPTTHDYNYETIFPPSLSQPTRFTWQQLEEKIEKGICYNCDRKYIKGHKCDEKKLFDIDYEEEEEKDQKNIKRRGYTLGTNPKERRIKPDHIL